MKRNPHPARRSRITALGVSTTAFVSVVTSFAWNTHQAELAANVVDANALPAGQPIAVSSSAAPAVPNATTSVTPGATIAPAVQAPSAKNGSTTAPTVVPATPVAPAAPKATAPAAPKATAPAAPAATVVYTCMSPGGKTENPTATGKCKNAKYGYVLTQV